MQSRGKKKLIQKCCDTFSVFEMERKFFVTSVKEEMNKKRQSLPLEEFFSAFSSRSLSLSLQCS